VSSGLPFLNLRSQFGQLLLQWRKLKPTATSTNLRRKQKLMTYIVHEMYYFKTTRFEELHMYTLRFLPLYCCETWLPVSAFLQHWVAFSAGWQYLKNKINQVISFYNIHIWQCVKNQREKNNQHEPSIMLLYLFIYFICLFEYLYSAYSRIMCEL
jgi:hypothetical protein